MTWVCNAKQRWAETGLMPQEESKRRSADKSWASENCHTCWDWRHRKRIIYILPATMLEYRLDTRRIRWYRQRLRIFLRQTKDMFYIRRGCWTGGSLERLLSSRPAECTREEGLGQAAPIALGNPCFHVTCRKLISAWASILFVYSEISPFKESTFWMRIKSLCVSKD